MSENDERYLSARLPSDFALHGVDVSVYQTPSAVPADADFVIVRATFGAKLDRRAAEHVTALRQRERCAVGLYHFFVPGQSTADQVEAFSQVADQCAVGAGDLIPWIDVESPRGDGSMPPRPEWCPQLLDMVKALQDGFGQVGLYITQRDWTLLGKPGWALELPLWVAHWRASPGHPASPGGIPPVFWQYRVGPWDRGALHRGEHTNPRAIDHDCCVTEALPLIVPPGEPIPETPTIPWIGLEEDDWDDMRAERDAALEEQDGPEAA